MEEYKPKILVTNDDGIMAPGIIAIVDRLHRLKKYDVRVASPSTEQSAKGHSITLHSLLQAHRYSLPEPLSSIVAWRVDGTPADCVKVVVNSRLFGDDWRPDLVVSGINRGANTGLSLHYSGTVGAAREGNICGVPAVALSLSFQQWGGVEHFAAAAVHGAKVVAETLRAAQEFPDFFRRVVVNANFPNLPEQEVKGWRLTKQGLSTFKDYYVEDNIEIIRDADGNVTGKTFRMEGRLDLVDPDDSFDTPAVRDGWISITPLGLLYSSGPQLEQTEEYRHMQQWQI